MAVSLVFSALTQTLTGALQGIGKVFVPAIGILLGCVCKVALNLTLIRIPEINIYGAAISSIACQIVAFLVNYIVLSKKIPLRITLGKYVIKPLIAGIAMGAAAFAVYHLTFGLLGGAGYVNNLISSFAAIAVAAVVYAILIFGMRIMDKEDIALLPGGGRLYSLLVKLKLYK